MNRKYLYLFFIFILISSVYSLTYVECDSTYTKDNEKYVISRDLNCFSSIKFEEVENSILEGGNNVIKNWDDDSVIIIDDCNDFEVKELNIKKGERGIYVKYSGEITIKDVDFENLEYGVYSKNLDTIKIWESNFENIKYNGVYSYNNDMLILIDSKFEDINDESVYLYKTDGFWIEDTNFFDIKDIAIYIRNSEKGEIDDCLFRDFDDDYPSVTIKDLDEKVNIINNRFFSEYISLDLEDIDSADIQNNYFKKGFQLEGNIRNIDMEDVSNNINIVGGPKKGGNYYEFWSGADRDSNYDGLSDSSFFMYSSYDIYDYAPLSNNYINSYYCSGSNRMANTPITNSIYIENCGSNSYGPWQRICNNGDVYKMRTNTLKGCLSGSCYTTIDSEYEKLEDCPFGCQDADCKPNSAPIITQNTYTSPDANYDNPILESSTLNFKVKSYDPNSHSIRLLVCNSNYLYNGECSGTQICSSEWGSRDLTCSMSASDYSNSKAHYWYSWVCDNHDKCTKSTSGIFYVDSIPVLKKNITTTDEDKEINLNLESYTSDTYKENLRYEITKLPNLNLINCSIEQNYIHCVPENNKFGKTNLEIRIIDKENQYSYNNLDIDIIPINDVPSIDKDISIINEKQLYNEKENISFYSNATDIESTTIMKVCDNQGIDNTNNCKVTYCESNYTSSEMNCSVNLSQIPNKNWKGYICDDSMCLLSNEGTLNVKDLNMRSPKLYINNEELFSYTGLYEDIIQGATNITKIEDQNIIIDFNLEMKSKVDIEYDILVNYKLINNPPELDFTKEYYEINESDVLEINPIMMDLDSARLYLTNNDSRLNKISNERFIWKTNCNDSGVYNINFTLSDTMYTDSKNITIKIKDKNFIPIIETLDYFKQINEKDVKIKLNITDLDDQEFNVSVLGLGYITFENDSYYYNLESNISLDRKMNVTILVNDSKDLSKKDIEIYIYNVDCYEVSDCDSLLQEDLVCHGNNVYFERYSYTCKNPGLDESVCKKEAIKTLNEECDEGCFNGKCIVITCHEDIDCLTNTSVYKNCKNDRLYDVYTKEVCKYPRTKNSYCESNNLYVLLSDCKYGCEDGSCIDGSDRCFDTDDGKDVSYSGYVLYDDSKYQDVCLENNYLKEYYCYKGEMKKAILKCPSYCIDGKCQSDSLIKNSYPIQEDLKYIGGQYLYFELNSTNSNASYHWYVNDKLVSTYDYLNYLFISGDYNVRGEISYNGFVNVKNWDINITPKSSEKKKPDLYVESFRLLNDYTQETNFITGEIVNIGEISATQVTWQIVQNEIDILNGTLAEISPGDYKTIMMSIELEYSTRCYNLEGDYIGEYIDVSKTDNDCYYEVKLILDSLDSVDEIDEDNNIRYLKD